MDLQFVGHATVLVDVGETRILTDPFLRRRLGPLERHGPVPDAASLRGVDLVLISHAHPDHFDPSSLAALPGAPTVIVPKGLGAAARASAAGKVIELPVGELVRAGGASVEAVEARHWMTPGGPRAQPQGYLL